MSMELVYTLCYLIAFVLFAVLTARLTGPSGRKHALFLVLAYGGAMAYGAHVLYFLVARRSLENESARVFWEQVEQGGELEFGDHVLRVLEASGGLWGGPLVVVLLTIVFLRLLRSPAEQKRQAADACAVALPFSLAIAKIGCFAVGCCYGAKCQGAACFVSDWAVAANEVSRFPSALLDVVAFTSVGIVLSIMYRRSVARGTLLLWFVVLYSVARFLTEFSRGDAVGGTYFGLSAVQWVVGLGILACAGALMRPKSFTYFLRGTETAAGSDITPQRRYVAWLCILEIATWPLAPIWALVFGALLLRSVVRQDPIGRANYAALSLLAIVGAASLYMVALLPVLVLATAVAVALPWLFNAADSRPSKVTTTCQS